MLRLTLRGTVSALTCSAVCWAALGLARRYATACWYIAGSTPGGMATGTCVGGSTWVTVIRMPAKVGEQLRDMAG